MAMVLIMVCLITYSAGAEHEPVALPFDIGTVIDEQLEDGKRRASNFVLLRCVMRVCMITTVLTVSNG
jgi:hypothetical protein